MLARSSAILASIALVTACTLSSPDQVQPLVERYDNVQGFFERYDGNRDGLISRQEAEQDPDLMLVFDHADTNHDGALDRGEFRQAAVLAVNNRRRGAAAGSGE